MASTRYEFTGFVLERKRPLLRFATALSGDPALADEIVAAALSKAWEHWGRIGMMDYPNSYVRKMVLNEFLSWRRGPLRRTRPTSDIPDFADQASDHAARLDERDALIERLATLPRKQRAALLLRFDEGMSDDEIAELLGCSAGAVRSNVSRALATLRIQMQAGEQLRPRAADAPIAPPAGRTTASNIGDPHAAYRGPGQLSTIAISKGQI